MNRKNDDIWPKILINLAYFIAQFILVATLLAILGFASLHTSQKDFNITFWGFFLFIVLCMSVGDLSEDKTIENLKEILVVIALIAVLFAIGVAYFIATDAIGEMLATLILVLLTIVFIAIYGWKNIIKK